MSHVTVPDQGSGDVAAPVLDIAGMDRRAHGTHSERTRIQLPHGFQGGKLPRADPGGHWASTMFSSDIDATNADAAAAMVARVSQQSHQAVVPWSCMA